MAATESQAFKMSRVLEEVARLSGEVDARRAILKDGLGDLEAMVQMVRGFGIDGLKRKFDDWKTPRTRGLSNVVLKGIAFSVLDEWALGCSNAKKVADLFKAVIFWGCHCSESLKYKQLADEILAMGSAMVVVFEKAQDFGIWTNPNYGYEDMNMAIDKLRKLHLRYKTKQLDRPSASAAGTAEAADGHQFGGQAADNGTSSATAAAAGTAAEAADDGNGGAASGAAESF